MFEEVLDDEVAVLFVELALFEGEAAFVGGEFELAGS